VERTRPRAPDRQDAGAVTLRLKSAQTLSDIVAIRAVAGAHMWRGGRWMLM
jgi:hypothetical protein